MLTSNTRGIYGPQCPSCRCSAQVDQVVDNNYVCNNCKTDFKYTPDRHQCKKCPRKSFFLEDGLCDTCAPPKPKQERVVWTVVLRGGSRNNPSFLERIFLC